MLTTALSSVLCTTEEVCAYQTTFPLWQAAFMSRQANFFLNTPFVVNRVAKSGNYAIIGLFTDPIISPSCYRPG